MVVGVTISRVENEWRKPSLFCKARLETRVLWKEYTGKIRYLQDSNQHHVLWGDRCMLSAVIWPLTGPMTATYLCVESAM